MHITSEPGVTKELFHGSSNYKPVELTEDFVFKHAHLLTLQEMADMFSITRNTIDKRFGHIYHQALQMHKVKRRHQLERALDDVAPSDTYHHWEEKAKTREFTALMRLWMMRYDGLTEKTIEKTTEQLPSVSEIKFEPLKKAE